MKLSKLLCTAFAALTLSLNQTTHAEGPRCMNPARPTRGLFGMPVPQQWTGARPTGYGYANDYDNCPNGRCGTGNCANGNCGREACANGRCGTGDCRNGQCDMNYETQYRPTRGMNESCPNGVCNLNNRPSRPSVYPSASDWAPRSTRGVADPYRRATATQESDWTQRSLRPVLEPIDETLRSRYSRDELDLRSDYFRGSEEQDRFDDEPVRPTSRQRNAPSGRSIEAPMPASRSTRI